MYPLNNKPKLVYSSFHTIYLYIKSQYRLAIIIIVFLLILFFSLIMSQDINLAQSLHPPSISHPLGTTILGKDIFSQLIIAIRYSVLLSILTTLFTAVIGTMISLIILNRKYMDTLVQIISNILLAFPPFIICLLFISRWGGATKILVLGQFLAFLPICIKLSYKSLFHTMQQEHALTAMGMGNT